MAILIPPDQGQHSGVGRLDAQLEEQHVQHCALSCQYLTTHTLQVVLQSTHIMTYRHDVLITQSKTRSFVGCTQ
jgi:hypothetical protein